jgi:hypothetical protein
MADVKGQKVCKATTVVLHEMIDSINFACCALCYQGTGGW